MNSKNFNCNYEDLPVVTGFILTSFENDKLDFLAYSPLFADPFLSNARAKHTECTTIVKASDILKYQKAAKGKLDQLANEIRLYLNEIEGYLKLAKSSLNISVDDFGLSTIREAIASSSREKIASGGQSLLVHLRNNATALSAVGFSNQKLENFETMLNNLSSLNNEHNDKKNERIRTADTNIDKFNALWDVTTTIVDAARAIYKGKNEVKLREYTISNVMKRIHNSSSSSDKKDDTETSPEK